MFNCVTKRFFLFLFILFPWSCSGSSSPTGPGTVGGCGSAFSVYISGTASATAGSSFDINVRISNAPNVTSAPFYLHYNKDYVSFVSATEGNFLNQDSASTVFLTSNDAANGRVIVGLSRLGDSVGISGSGTLMTAAFKADAAGSANFSIQSAALTGSGGALLTPLACGATVTIN